MRTAALYRELGVVGLENVEIFRSSPLTRISFRFPDNTVLKITYWANSNITAGMIARAVVANRHKAVVVDGPWVPASATVRLN